MQTRVVPLGATRDGLAAASYHPPPLPCSAGLFCEGHPPENTVALNVCLRQQGDL